MLAASIASGPAAVRAHGPYHAQLADCSSQIARSPDSAPLYVARGEIYRAHGDTDAALADFGVAARLDPTLTEIDFLKGRALLDGQRAQLALSYLDHFLKGHPGHAAALMLRGRALGAVGRPGDGGRDYRLGLEQLRTPTPDDYLMLSKLYGDAGQADLALGGLDAGIRRLGPVVSLELPAIELDVRARRWDAALGRLDRLTAQSPRKELWLYRRGDLAVRAGRPTEARRAFAAALDAINSLPAPARDSVAMTDLKDKIRKALSGPTASPDYGASVGRSTATPIAW